jgi:hypothetical protein
MSYTNYAKNKIQDLMLGGVALTPPSNYYLALSTTNISVSGSNLTEPVGAAYARIIIPNTKSYFTNSSSGCLVNSASIVYVESSGSWGTIVDIALTDAITSGSVWMYTTLTSPKIVQSDTVISFSASAITFSQS